MPQWHHCSCVLLCPGTENFFNDFYVLLLEFPQTCPHLIYSVVDSNSISSLSQDGAHSYSKIGIKLYLSFSGEHRRDAKNGRKIYKLNENFTIQAFEITHVLHKFSFVLPLPAYIEFLSYLCAAQPYTPKCTYFLFYIAQYQQRSKEQSKNITYVL